MLLPGIVALTLVGIAVGAVTRSWLALIVPAMIPLLYMGIDEGSWGSPADLGENWQWAAAFMTALGLLAVGVAIAVMKAVSDRAGAKNPDADDVVSD